MKPWRGPPLVTAKNILLTIYVRCMFSARSCKINFCNFFSCSHCATSSAPAAPAAPAVSVLNGASYSPGHMSADGVSKQTPAIAASN